jgi:hypothetical protein
MVLLSQMTYLFNMKEKILELQNAQRKVALLYGDALQETDHNKHKAIIRVAREINLYINYLLDCTYERPYIKSDTSPTGSEQALQPSYRK